MTNTPLSKKLEKLQRSQVSTAFKIPKFRNKEIPPKWLVPELQEKVSDPGYYKPCVKIYFTYEHNDPEFTAQIMKSLGITKKTDVDPSKES